MKLNWGHGILIFIVLFMTFILNLVYKCSQQTVDLVSEKYYEQELKYQQQVNKLNNTAAQNDQLSVCFDKQFSSVEIHYPANTDPASLSGNVNFFKPDNSHLDFNIAVKGDKENVQAVPVSKLKKGWWKVQVSWTSAGTSFYKEQKVLID
ncbi:MAG: FixH family protein [Bacteroidetes bacterium]|nr:FixH family protein [Bacteroidota bacterium]